MTLPSLRNGRSLTRHTKKPLAVNAQIMQRRYDTVRASIASATLIPSRRRVGYKDGGNIRLGHVGRKTTTLYFSLVGSLYQLIGLYRIRWSGALKEVVGPASGAGAVASAAAANA